MHAKSLQSCLTLCNPMDCSLPGSSVHRILQARIMEWVATSYLQGIFLTQGLNPHLLCLLHWQVGSLPTSTTWEAPSNAGQQKTSSERLDLGSWQQLLEQEP